MRLMFAILFSLLTGCSSMGTMTAHHDPAKPRSVFVEGFGEYDTYTELYEYAGMALARRGYDAVKDDKAASYRLRSSITWSLRRISLAVRLVEAQSGQVVYFGECDNPGFGTFISSGKAMADCFRDALAKLE